MFKNITLEISLKPFKQTTDEYIQNVCRRVFEQWKPLIKNREIISIMMWSADGSELLDYTGEFDKEFEWCRYIGNANLPLLEDLPPETTIHQRKQLYMENPPKMTYKILKKIVTAFKDEGKRLFPNARIKIGTTFDIGGEFAVSDFKYNRHKEVCKGVGCQGVGFIDANAVLNGDAYPYAAFPKGIPDKTPMGTFLGAQANVFMRDMGFEYIWLSNGFGFSFEPWQREGVIYDGKEFHIDKLTPTKEKLLNFWKLFRRECYDFDVETRGTNYSVGVDYACDGVPLYDIYKENPYILPPPNSPWAAINDDVGIEVIGQLTRNCILPGNDYMFRFYAHDIWWMNSPWYDRYGCSPYDIYIPMALARIDENAKIQNPSILNILSVDNSRGEMPDICANEIIPHLLKAEKDAPDEPSPIVLVYPFREYTTANSVEMLEEMYFAELFLRDAVNNGFPIATVVSTDNFVKHPNGLYDKSILLVPALTGNKEVDKKLKEYALNKGKIITYGKSKSLKSIDYISEKVNIKNGLKQLFDAMKKFEYSIEFLADKECKLPSLTLHRNGNSMIFSVYNRNTTVETRLKFPLGAPVLDGFTTKLYNGYASYHFNKCVHGECRVFVKQNDGMVAVKESPTDNTYYRRKIQISGLNNADVALFGEEYCKEKCIVTKEITSETPIPMKGWKVVSDKENGTYLYGHNISGTILLCMPKKI